jgi:hypothetical protein
VVSCFQFREQITLMWTHKTVLNFNGVYLTSFSVYYTYFGVGPTIGPATRSGKSIHFSFFRKWLPGLISQLEIANEDSVLHTLSWIFLVICSAPNVAFPQWTGIVM